MRAVIQRSLQAKVEVDGEIKGEIQKGLVVFLGITHNDTEKDIDYLVEKIINLRLIEENKQEFEKSLLDTNEEMLIISQFTLYANCKKGRRPDFIKAAKSDIAKPLYEKFIEKIRMKGIKTAEGIFGAMMNITLTNYGPVTIILESGIS